MIDRLPKVKKISCPLGLACLSQVFCRMPSRPGYKSDHALYAHATCGPTSLHPGQEVNHHNSVPQLFPMQLRRSKRGDCGFPCNFGSLRWPFGPRPFPWALILFVG